MDVLPVTDEFGVHIVVLRSRAYDAGLAVVDSGHGVEEMGQMGRPRLVDGTGLLIACVRVGNRHGAERGCLPGKIRRSRQFGREVHDADKPAAALIELPERLKIRRAQIGRVLGTFLFFGEEGTLHVDSQQSRAARGGLVVKPPGCLIGPLQDCVGQGHGSGGKAGHAVFGQEGRHGFQPLIVSIGEIRAGVAVGMNVDQARDHQRAVEVESVRPLAGEELAEAAVPDREAAADKARRRKDLRILKNHIRPPAGWPRRCSGRRVEPSRPEA